MLQLPIAVTCRRSCSEGELTPRTESSEVFYGSPMAAVVAGNTPGSTVWGPTGPVVAPGCGGTERM
jgi:hypothetical protein